MNVFEALLGLLIPFAFAYAIYRLFRWCARADDPAADTDDPSVRQVKNEKTFLCMVRVMLAEVMAFVDGGFIAMLLSLLGGEAFHPGMFAIGIFIGAYLGIRQAARNRLPKSAVFRYVPLLLPIAGILFWAVRQNIQSGDMSYRNCVFWVSAVLYHCVSFFVFFVAGCAFAKKRFTGKVVLSLSVAVVAGLASVFAWQAVQRQSVTFSHGYSGPTVAEYVDLSAYDPANEGNTLARLESSPDSRVKDNFPLVDGATAFYPIYAAVLNATYDLPDRAEFGKYLFCSRTPEAYARLIRKEVDVIFAFQPSDGQIESARAAGVDLRLIPIAREAFVFFVNNANPVSDLTIGQIRDIYSKKTTNWRDVGGKHARILPFQRPDDSGSQTAMIKEVMRGTELTKPLREEYLISSMMGMIRRVAHYRDSAESIGYSFRFFARNMATLDPYNRMERYKPSDGSVKLLRVNGVDPS